MKKIGISYIADDKNDERACKVEVRKLDGRLQLNERPREWGFRVSDADNDSGVDKSVFGLNMLSDEAYLRENGRQR